MSRLMDACKRAAKSKTARKMLQQIAKTAAIILIDRGLGGRKQRR